MSFSSKAKNELARKVAINDCCAVAQISAFAHLAGKIELKGSGNLTFQMSTEHSPTARCIYRLIKSKLNIEAHLMTKENVLKKKHIYAIVIDDFDQAKALLSTLKLLDQNGGMHFELDESLFVSKCCETSFLRGCFLGSGSISDPEKAYHLEIVSNTKEFSVSLLNLLNKHSIKAAQIQRKETTVVYIKEGDSIIRFLTLIGAHSTVLSLENIRISKDIMNNINRAANCDAANFSKTVEAAVRQVQAIIHLKEIGQLEKLPESLFIVAEARMNNQTATLTELTKIMDGQIGKSGINHRLRKICEISESLV
jgi:cell division protein WhiA